MVVVVEDVGTENSKTSLLSFRLNIGVKFQATLGFSYFMVWLGLNQINPLYIDGATILL